jgi:hypothetical protein
MPWSEFWSVERVGPGWEVVSDLKTSCVHLDLPEHGEWFTGCAADGQVLDSAKGGRYKAAYHTVAACVQTALWLERWPRPSSA